MSAGLVAFPELDGTQACRDADPELFFPNPSDTAGLVKAKAVCAACPLLRPCAAYALTHAVAGVWGGTSESDRQRLQRRHGMPQRVVWSSPPASTRPEEPIP